MLTADQIDDLRGSCEQLVRPITEYILRDIAERIAAAGKITSTAAYKVWVVQQMGISQRNLKQYLRKTLGLSKKELEDLIKSSAQAGYSVDISRFPTTRGIPFEQNEALQGIVLAATETAGKTLENLTQTLGMIGPNGKALPLQKVYRECMDFMFTKVITGASDYNTAFMQATNNLVKAGVQTIDYQSGRHMSLEAAVRGNLMGGLGVMQEKISEKVHEDLGCDGWEISAHACSAPDHEPIQGKQFSDADYKKLNNSLVRRISTLNCGHVASPIIMGINKPQYTEEQLEKFRADNEAGFDYEGKHYTMYEATQRQRQIERSIRFWERRRTVYSAGGQTDKAKAAEARLTQLMAEYRRFSKAAGLREQFERTWIADS